MENWKLILITVIENRSNFVIYHSWSLFLNIIIFFNFKHLFILLAFLFHLCFLFFMKFRCLSLFFTNSFSIFFLFEFLQLINSFLLCFRYFPLFICYININLIDLIIYIHCNLCLYRMNLINFNVHFAQIIIFLCHQFFILFILNFF